MQPKSATGTSRGINVNLPRVTTLFGLRLAEVANTVRKHFGGIM